MTDTGDEEQLCPACKSKLAPNAILCIDCGFNLKTGQHLTTVTEAANEDDATPASSRDLANPYASPVEESRIQDTGQFDLDDRGTRHAERVVSGARVVYPLMLFSTLCCLPIFVVLLPYYGFLLVSWYSLRSRYNELRNPNSFSPNGQLAADFEDAHFKLVLAIVLAILVLTLVALGWRGRLMT